MCCRFQEQTLKHHSRHNSCNGEMLSLSKVWFSLRSLVHTVEAQGCQLRGPLLLSHHDSSSCNRFSTSAPLGSLKGELPWPTQVYNCQSNPAISSLVFKIPTTIEIACMLPQKQMETLDGNHPASSCLHPVCQRGIHKFRITPL